MDWLKLPADLGEGGLHGDQIWEYGPDWGKGKTLAKGKKVKEKGVTCVVKNDDRDP